MPHPRSPLVKNKGEVYGSRNELVILIAVHLRMNHKIITTTNDINSMILYN